MKQEKNETTTTKQNRLQPWPIRNQSVR